MKYRRIYLDIMKSFLILLLGFILITPLFLLFVGSLKDNMYQIEADFGSISAFYVEHPSLNNFIEITANLRYFINSVIIMIGSIAGTIIISSMFGFVLLRGKFRFNKTLLLIIILLYIIPQETIMLPLLFESLRLRLTNTFIIQIIPFIASPLYIFMFYQFFKEIPESIAEAAQIDGAGLWSTFLRIYLHLCKPVLVTVAILQGIDAWNQYLWPILVTRSESVRPITIAIASYFGNSRTFWDQLFALSVLMLMPVLLLYLFFQKYFIASVSSSAIKG